MIRIRWEGSGINGVGSGRRGVERMVEVGWEVVQ